MKIELIEKENKCIIEKEIKDPKFYGVVGAKGESNLLYHIKHILNKQGFDFIKKRMWKDGHLVDNI